MTASAHAWFDGHVVPRGQADPSVASNTLHLGIAVFDGLMAYRNGRQWHVLRAREHFERFTEGAARMDLELPWDVPTLVAGVEALLETLPPRTHYIRPIAYRRAPVVFFDTPGVEPSAAIFGVPVERDVDAPLTCQLSPVQRLHHAAVPVAWKVSGAYANSYRAEREAQAAGFDTGLMLDVRGRVAEASSSNVFFVHDGELVTPKTDGDVFPGITRALVLDIAEQAGVTLAERDVWPAELGSFEAAFLCGSLSEIRTIARVGDVTYDSPAHPLVRRVVEAFRDVTHGQPR
jgi:branched-chain amino acid aminotransferase